MWAKYLMQLEPHHKSHEANRKTRSQKSKYRPTYLIQATNKIKKLFRLKWSKNVQTFQQFSENKNRRITSANKHGMYIVRIGKQVVKLWEFSDSCQQYDMLTIYKVNRGFESSFNVRLEFHILVCQVLLSTFSSYILRNFHNSQTIKKPIFYIWESL